MAVSRLGRGLSALIPDVPSDQNSRYGRLEDVEISEVVPNPFQPRETFDAAALEELKQSIAENGVIQPISVREVNSGYELIAGERRLRAVRDLGLLRIPAFIRQVGTDKEMLELSLIENIQRENLNPIDEANGFQTLISKCNLTQEEVANKIGKDRSTITNSLRILRLPKAIQDSLAKAELTAGHARALLSLSNSAAQIQLWKRVVRNKYSVRQVEKFVKGRPTTERTRKDVKRESSPFIKETEDKLRTNLATQVRILANKSGTGGKIEIEYYSNSDLERIVELVERI